MVFKRVRTSEIDRVLDSGDVEFSDRELTASIMDRLRALETSHASSGKSMDDREPALSASPKRTSIAAVGWNEPVWLATVPERLQSLEASLAALSKSDKQLQVPDDVAEPYWASVRFCETVENSVFTLSHRVQALVQGSEHSYRKRRSVIFCHAEECAAP